MRVLLIGGYQGMRQQSMDRFAASLCERLTAAGHEVRLARPPMRLGAVFRHPRSVAKWIGYIDRFLLDPPLLRRQARWADVVHICDQANAVYVRHLAGTPTVVTCHDMIAIRAAFGEMADVSVRWTGRLYQRWILRSLGRADLIVCDSTQTMTDVQRLCSLPQGRARVVKLALHYPYHPMPREEAERHLETLGIQDSRPFLLHVGGNAWYKNRLGVLTLFSELTNRPGFLAHRLMIVGEPLTSELGKVARTLQLGDRVAELGEVTNEQLRALYSTAEALLFPSLYEGFGWPILEAQACGCVALTTNRPPMTEVGGSAGVYFDPTDVTSAIDTIVSALSDSGNRREESQRNAARFSPDEMIAGYLRSYADARRGAGADRPGHPDPAQNP
jgi:glycosyltransferase involved in cell wall biosynthesis